ncbi:MAG: single-stranded DNA-binding protein [Microbacteriaceae bacterium]
MADTVITVVGNLTADPELRFTANGLAVANFTIASTPRTFDRASNEWKDGEALFLRASVWREFAENVAATLSKGMRVVATGKLKQRSYETKEGEKRTAIELEVDEIGPSLRYAKAQVSRSASQGRPDAVEDAWGSGSSSNAPQTNSWASDTKPAAENWGAPGANYSDEAPF